MNKNILTIIKFTVLIFCTSLTVFIRSWQPITLFTIMIMAITFILRPKRDIKERLKPLFIIGVFVLFFQLIFNRSISLENRLMTGLVTAEKITTLSILVFLFTATTSISEIISLFSLLPRKLSLALTITFSLLPVIMDESKKIALVQSARGYCRPILNPSKSIFPIIIPLLHRTLKRAEQIAVVIVSRGYYTHLAQVCSPKGRKS